MFSLATLRRKQKMIFWIMVLLMITFLVGFQGFNMLLQKNPNARPIATIRGGEVSLSDKRQANIDLSLLFNPYRMTYRPVPNAPLMLGDGLPGMHRYLVSMIGGQKNKSDIYATLLAEARAKGYTTTEGEVDRLINAMKLQGTKGYSYDAIVKELRLSQQQITERDIRGVLARLSLVHRAAADGTITSPPSDEELRLFFRNKTEKIALRAIKLPHVTAADTKPVDTKTLFEAYKAAQRDDVSDVTKFPFGYQMPAKAQIASLLLDRPAVIAAARASKEAITNFIATQPASTFIKTVTVEPTIETKDGEKREKFLTKDIPMSYKEKIQTAQKELQPKVAETLYADLLAAVRRELDTAATKTDASANPYPAIAQSFVLPAKALLETKIELIAAKDVTVEEAIAELESAGGDAIVAIVYPTEAIDAKTKISLLAKNTTVGAMLASLHTQAQAANKDLPAIKWAGCKALEGVLIPADKLPIRSHVSPLADAKTLGENSLYRTAYNRNATERDEFLVSPAEWAVRARPVTKDGKLEVGKDAPVVELLQGTLFWRVLAAQGAKTPEAATPEIQTQLDADALSAATFAKVDALAKTLTTAKAAEAYATANKLVPTVVDLFTRNAQPGTINEELKQAIAIQAFKDAVFEQLTPSDKALADGAYPKASPKAIVVSLPCEQAVYLVWRVDYTPALERDFTTDRESLFLQASNSRIYQSLRNWVTWDLLKTRTGFKWDDDE